MGQQSAKQSLIISAVTVVLVLLIVASALFHLQGESQTQAISEVNASEVSNTLPLPSNETAFKQLFGTASPSKPGSMVKTAPNKLTSFWFEQSFTQGGDHLHVKFFATQSLDESGQPIDSHAQSVEVGAISYQQNANKWQVLSKQPQFGVAGAWGKVDKVVAPEVLQLSPTSLAVMLDAADGMGGWHEEGKTIFVFAQNAWHDTGYVQTGGDNLGTCNDAPPVADEELPLAPCYRYSGTISVINGSTSEYPDLLVTRTGTEGEEHLGKLLPARNVTYVFKDGKYSALNPPE